MDENEYRSAYQSLNTNRCVFEKSILTHYCGCRFHERFNLAEREGVRCTKQSSQQNCKTFLSQCRQQARFALRVPEIIGDLLPHNKEVQLQKGALMGLAPELPNLPGTEISDIYSLIEKALDISNGDLLEFPYHSLVSSISSHPPRRKRHRSRRKN